MPRKRSDNPAAAFQATVRAALERLNDPAWLAAQSPLATVYFLGDRTGEAGGDLARGRALRALLHEAMDHLWDGPLPPTPRALVDAVEEARRDQGNTGDEYAYLLLELRFFRRHFAPRDYPAQVTDIPVFLHVSTTRFFVHLDRAIDRLGERLLRLARPALRPERPPAPGRLLGRARELAAVRGALAAGRGVAISGPGGVGKTTLGAAAVADRPPDSVFWYTFLPNFNDNLPALLFTLAHFLHGLGRSTLWRQLLADRGRALDPEQALGMARADLAAMPFPPVLCFDEIDLLHTSDGDTRSAAHAQMLSFLEALSRDAATLFIGQRGYIDVPFHVALEPLDATDTAAMLADAGLVLSERQAARVREVTDGLPRLVELVIALLRDGDELDEIVRLHLRADARPLFNRLWRRLDRPERELLLALAVFRGPAPGDAWPAHAAAGRSLRDRGLLKLNEIGEASLMPFFRRLIYEEMRAEQRESAHGQAATLRAARGEFTAAAFHYARAGEPEAAVAVWFPNRELEIERGAAGAALDVFSDLSARRLPPGAAARLRIIQNQLYLLAGQAQRVVENAAGFDWQINGVPAAEAHFQEAEARRQLGQSDAALEAYERVIAAALERVALVAESFTHRGMIHLREGNTPAAYREARRAHLQANSLDGYLDLVSGRYAEAEQHFRRALEDARQERADDPIVIHIHRYLGFIAGSRGNLAAAEHHYGIAIDYFKRTGNTVNLEGARADLCGVLLNLRRFEQFIPLAEHALRFFDQIGHEARTAQLTADLAEAYLETGRLDEATAYAHRVLQMENPRHRPYALYTLGLIHQRQGRPDHAAAAFADGIRTAQSNRDRFIEAYLHRLDGRLRLAQGDTAGGQAALETALMMFVEMGIEGEAEATREELRVVSG